MIFVQPFLYNFCTIFSLFFFLSLLVLTNEKKEQQVVPKVVLKELFKYHYSNIYSFNYGKVNSSKI